MERKKHRYRTRNRQIFSTTLKNQAYLKGRLSLRACAVTVRTERRAQQPLTMATSSAAPEAPLPPARTRVWRAGTARRPAHEASQGTDRQACSGNDRLSLRKQNAAAQLPPTPRQTQVLLCVFYFPSHSPTAVWERCCSSLTWEMGAGVRLAFEGVWKVPDTAWPRTGHKATAAAAASVSQTLQGSRHCSARRLATGGP